MAQQPAGPNPDTLPDGQQITDLVISLEQEMAALRARFDQFFLGLEKKNPQHDLERLRAKMVKLRGYFVRNTGLKFRIDTLFNKFLTMERLWTKSLREIEEGTYRRDLFKLRWRNQHKGGEPPPPPDARPAAKPAEPKPAEPGKSSGARPPPPPPDALRPAGPPPPPADEPLSRDRIEKVYRDYVEAKRRCNESTAGLTVDALAQSLKKQVPQLLKQHNARSVEFKVVVKDGRAVLKAIPRS